MLDGARIDDKRLTCLDSALDSLGTLRVFVDDILMNGFEQVLDHHGSLALSQRFAPRNIRSLTFGQSPLEAFGKLEDPIAIAISSMHVDCLLEQDSSRLLVSIGNRIMQGTHAPRTAMVKTLV